MMKLSCPSCGFSKDIPSDRIPPGTKRVACPNCHEKFSLEGAMPAPRPVAVPAPLSPPQEKPAADQITMVCPHCNARRNMPREKIPQRAVRVNCPQCRKVFTFHGDRMQGKDVLVRPEQHPVLAITPATEAEPESTRRATLSNLGELFAKSWQTFIQRVMTLVGINLLALVLAGLGYLLLGGLANWLEGLTGGSVLSNVAVLTLMTIYSLIVIAWLGAAVTYAIVEEDLGVRQSLGYGLQRLWSFLWVSLLVWFIISGGYLLFFIPGLLFTTWFLFAQFIMAREDIRGMEALLKSKEYVSGHGWAVLGRILLVGVVVGAISIPLAFIPILGGLASLLLGFFLMVYYAEILKELTEIKGNITFDCSRGVKTRWMLVGGAGYLVTLAAGLALGEIG
ncbi:MAG: zinc-ribbon domain-containing protein [Desulfuromonadales bacterium]|nr:zinc-ribbon domain-containing protein [Desulfuromonadales bacterium]